ncbi:hypothetical protein AYO49_03605 [Verrucomicrobiaceae bacterium SCGC AG-212-N21]|nr:hypothetical protein AYO49_03605 [Verrucomicrobiaceae bacterium SCGC AG-212-N21]
MPLPDDWIRRERLNHDEIYQDPPQSKVEGRNHLIGLSEADDAHHIYDIPAATTFGDVARAFRVGSHSAISYGDVADETVEMVARKLDVIEGISSGRVVFADSAGLKVRFHRPISADDYPLIEALFPEDEMMQAGLEAYVSEWSGDGHPLEPLRGSDLLHLWWD